MEVTEDPVWAQLKFPTALPPRRGKEQMAGCGAPVIGELRREKILIFFTYMISKSKGGPLSSYKGGF